MSTPEFDLHRIPELGAINQRKIMDFSPKSGNPPGTCGENRSKRLSKSTLESDLRKNPELRDNKSKKNHRLFF